jgi:flavin reductase (DIM6/NTAB) family NADH-FMN oxidoreductase RutF
VDDEGMPVSGDKYLLANGSELDVIEFRRTLGSFMTGVTIVTTVDRDGRHRGMTMTSFTSVSLDPPLVLVCVDRGAASFDAFVESRGIAVHILASAQEQLARTFASKAPDKFEHVVTEAGHGGAPIIRDVHAYLDCVTDQVVIAGDHAIIVARVLDFGSEDRRPLAFYQGKFNSFSVDEQILQQQIDAHSRTTVRWVVETDAGDLVAHEGDDGSLRLPEVKLKPSELSHGGLSAAATACIGVTTAVDFLYSIYDGQHGEAVLVYRGRTECLNPVLAHGLTLAPTLDGVAGRFTDTSERAVIRRYVNERLGASFGIYAGNQLEGAVASLGAVSTDAREEGAS